LDNAVFTAVKIYASPDPVHPAECQAVFVLGVANGGVTTVNRQVTIATGFSLIPVDAVLGLDIDAGAEGDDHRFSHGQMVHDPGLGLSADPRLGRPTIHPGTHGNVAHSRRQYVANLEIIQIATAASVSPLIINSDLEADEIVDINLLPIGQKHLHRPDMIPVLPHGRPLRYAG